VLAKWLQVFLTPEHLAIVMEYAAGGELFDTITAAGQFPEDVARYFFQQLITGVAWCHSQVAAGSVGGGWPVLPASMLLPAAHHLRGLVHQADNWGCLAFCVPQHFPQRWRHAARQDQHIPSSPGRHSLSGCCMPMCMGSHGGACSCSLGQGPRAFFPPALCAATCSSTLWRKQAGRGGQCFEAPISRTAESSLKGTSGMPDLFKLATPFCAVPPACLPGSQGVCQRSMNLLCAAACLAGYLPVVHACTLCCCLPGSQGICQWDMQVLCAAACLAGCLPVGPDYDDLLLPAW
jgi:hypothetical protein